MLIILASLLFFGTINAFPSHVVKSASIEASVEDSASKPLFSFDNGNVGVNFLGYRASAGLGGLLTGKAADGGLHAEAGTPYGQNAGAGLGGTVNADGVAAGGLYAGATAGGGVSAGANLAGIESASGSFSKSYAGASAGSGETHITKIAHKAPAAIAGEFTASVAAPVKEVEIQQEVKPQTTYIERTVIPNYVEKTIQVPTYVEKTIRVPTTVEKKIRVPAEPTIIEKTVEAPAQTQTVGVRGSYGAEVEVPQTVTYVQKTKVHRRPVHSHIHYKHFGGGAGSGAGFGGFGFGGGYGGGYGGGASGSYSVTKTANPQFFNDIFNIPISTLGAVNKLVSGLAGGASGSLAVSKSFGVAGGAAGSY